ncbi:TetR/AcrR family transcriptional regulator [Mesonia aestuariivivens]|uniref:TetR/AcrR family transcriptional regulator n=1 Tax=Mesonia aestuariivivens TaxID=2796128 RepID=A0ABS6W201_9FLAO|nr:TetR/AcrR family transcriptional regulator [Mesonia aestuariivivens]MBW2961881.1 TetR/AcrR family transcriptional regulator [Mesonia aestuariivivens]
MKEQILDTAAEMFLSLGFKSVTMDDIAEKLSISKKTIYSHFPNKEKLIESCAVQLFNSISARIDMIIAEHHNPIDELLMIHEFILKQLKKEKASPQFQLYKYYPKVDDVLKERKIERMKLCIGNNLKRGIKEGLYRENIDLEIVQNFYFMTIEGIKHSDFFPMDKYDIPYLVTHFLDYHFRAIASQKGLEYINNLNYNCQS